MKNTNLTLLQNFVARKTNQTWYGHSIGPAEYLHLSFLTVDTCGIHGNTHCFWNPVTIPPEEIRDIDEGGDGFYVYLKDQTVFKIPKSLPKRATEPPTQSAY